MPLFAVRFKGMLAKSERERLEAAGVEIVDHEPSMKIGIVKTGVPIYTVHVNADSADRALQTVQVAMEPDTSNFTLWESEPA